MASVRLDLVKLSAALVLALVLILPAAPLAQQGGKVEVLWLGQAAFKVGDVKELAAKTKAKVFGPAGLIATLVDLGWVSAEQGVRFGKGGKVQPLGPQITITQVRAEHSSEVTVTDPATKKSTTYPGGEPAGFIIELENGFKLYHMGDTSLFGDMKLIADYDKPDLVLMPIGHLIPNAYVLTKNIGSTHTRCSRRNAVASEF